MSDVCTYLATNEVLKNADQLVVAGTPDHSLLKTTLAQMEQVAAVAPPYMQLATRNIVDGLESLTGTPDTGPVLPDSRLPAGECRARNLAIPGTG